MIFDLNTINKNPFETQQYDICIIGGGVAGITLALYLDPKFNILLLEGGGLEYSQESQELYEGKNIGWNYPPLDVWRMRCLGGSSHLWGGWCAPLNEFEFEKKSYIKYSGWPIKKSDLDPFEKEAKSILDLPEKTQVRFIKGWTDKLETKNEDFDSDTFKFSFSYPPTNFKNKYLTKLKEQSNIHCYLNANLTDMVLNDEHSTVNKVEIKNYLDNSFYISAKQYILATGGMENPRLLLNFNKQMKKGIGNDNDLVGRFFSDHIRIPAGDFIVKDDIKEIFENETESEFYPFTTSHEVPTKKLQKEEKILPAAVLISPNKKLFNRTWSKKFKQQIKELACTTEWSYDLLKKVTDKNIICDNEYDGKFGLDSSHTPNPLSRITLGQNIDKFGLKRIILDWRMSETDVKTIKVCAIRMAERFATIDIGRMKLKKWYLNNSLKFEKQGRVLAEGAAHHMGTTRMGHSPETGVVDKYQKVFNIDNLYIAGSSVFVTTGYENPTFTIVQMTLRLADHLNKILQK